jgi:chromosome segregation ATPase
MVCQTKTLIHMVKKFLLGLSLAGVLWGCDSGEKEKLRAEVDSLRTELHTSQEMAQSLNDIGTLLDSIDASRQLLRTEVVEGTSYTDYKNRLENLNAYIRETQSKIEDLEKSLKTAKSSSSTYAASIKKLKLDLEERTNQVAALEQEVTRMRDENSALTRTVSERDSAITVKDETIQMREQDVATLESKVEEINTTNKTNQADLYFAQAEALETAAERTKFAPKKKKETQREALELYKLSLSLGKEEAQQKIDELTKVLS